MVRELVEYAKEIGFAEASFLPSSELVVEERVALKCFTCKNYGKIWSCPPFAPKPSEFKKALSEFDWAILARFKGDPSDWDESKRRAHRLLLKLEKRAYELGKTIFFGLRPGYCNVCDKCTAPSRPCVNRRLMRFSPEALGVNLIKTCEKAGISLEFNPRSADPVVILLI